jgi:hypothetical protein
MLRTGGMTQFKSLILACSLALAACAVDPTESDEGEESIPEATEVEAVEARAVETPVGDTKLELTPQTQFWCDKKLQDSGTAYDNARCRHRWWKQWHKTFPCSTYWVEYGPWVAGC